MNSLVDSVVAIHREDVHTCMHVICKKLSLYLNKQNLVLLACTLRQDKSASNILRPEDHEAANPTV